MSTIEIMTQKAQYVKRAVNEKFHEDCISEVIQSSWNFYLNY